MLKLQISIEGMAQRTLRDGRIPTALLKKVLWVETNEMVAKNLLFKGGEIQLKTNETLTLEKDIWRATKKQGVFGCLEVTIGWFGKERVDYLTYDTKGIWRCFEIKVSKADFHSNAHNTFIGHFNYYVMPKQLYDEVKDEIPQHIGVYIADACVKKAKKQALGVDEQILKDSLIRSLCRDVDKQMHSNDPLTINTMNRRLSEERAKTKEYKERFYALQNEVIEKYGRRWNRESEECYE